MPSAVRSRDEKQRPGRAFSLIELLIGIMIIAILGAVVIPMAASTPATTVSGAARLLVADIELAQSESIAHPDDPRLIKVDLAQNRYWIARVATPSTPISDPAGNGTMLVQFGSGRAASLSGVTIQGFALDKAGETGNTELRFDGVGQPDQATPATITLACQGITMTVTVAAESGEVTAAY